MPVPSPTPPNHPPACVSAPGGRGGGVLEEKREAGVGGGMYAGWNSYTDAAVHHEPWAGRAPGMEADVRALGPFRVKIAVILTDGVLKLARGPDGKTVSPADTLGVGDLEVTREEEIEVELDPEQNGLWLKLQIFEHYGGLDHWITMARVTMDDPRGGGREELILQESKELYAYALRPATDTPTPLLRCRLAPKPDMCITWKAGS